MRVQLSTAGQPGQDTEPQPIAVPIGLATATVARRRAAAVMARRTTTVQLRPRQQRHGESPRLLVREAASQIWRLLRMPIRLDVHAQLPVGIDPRSRTGGVVRGGLRAAVRGPTTARGRFAVRSDRTSAQHRNRDDGRDRLSGSAGGEKQRPPTIASWTNHGRNTILDEPPGRGAPQRHLVPRRPDRHLVRAGHRPVAVHPSGCEFELNH
jgi:hypothetical protein